MPEMIWNKYPGVCYRCTHKFSKAEIASESYLACVCLATPDISTAQKELGKENLELARKRKYKPKTLDEWTEMKSEHYAKRGFVHYHEFVTVDGGNLHPTKVVWLKHTAVTSFTLDRGPGGQGPNFPAPYSHPVTPGVDLMFPNNYTIPYIP